MEALPEIMQAMRLQRPGQPLQPASVAVPHCQPQQVLLRVLACAVCRTDLHILDGELKAPALPLTPGHEIVGEVVALGSDVPDAMLGKIVGVPWLGESCGLCEHCVAGRENLCDKARFTGLHIDGGYAEYAVAHQHYVFEILGDPLHAAPLLCAGLIGYRAFSMTGNPRRLGLYGFGAAAHILTQLCVQMGIDVYAFTRQGDSEGQAFARSLGACWAGASSEAPPHALDAAIIFAPAGELVVDALRAVRKGGRVVCGGIYMSPIPGFAYELLWGERSLCSVANLTRGDGEAFFSLLDKYPVSTHVARYPLAEANAALADLRAGRLQGAAVLVP